MAKKENGCKQAIVTVLLNGHDKPKPVKVKSTGWDHIMFTDDRSTICDGWRIIHVDPKDDTKKQSREIKILLHKFLPEYDRYIYIDASYEIMKDLNKLSSTFPRELVLFLHYARKCIYSESEEVKRLKLEDESIINAQIRKYKNQGFPARSGLYANGFFIRNNNSRINNLCEKWYREIERHSYRDQISLPYILWKTKNNVTKFHYRILRNYIRLTNHTVQRHTSIAGRRSRRLASATTDVIVHHATPGRGDKNLGKAYNMECAKAGPDDWICLRDGDTAFLNSYWPKQIEDIIKKYGHQYDLISCLTNRLGLKYQMLEGKLSENPDILYHHRLANEQYEKEYDVVTPCKKPTAGLFMLFPKKTWDKVKFREGLMVQGGFVDWHFSHAVLQQGMNIGIARGIYLFHFYRMGQKNVREIKHLVA